MRYYDTHLHAAARRDDDLDNLAWFGLGGALVVPARLRRAATAAQLMSAVQATLEESTARLVAHDVVASVAIGVPRAAAPRRRYDDVWLDLPVLASTLEAAAVGCVDVAESGADELLEAHAALARGLELPLLVDVASCRPDHVRGALACVTQAGQPAERTVVTGVRYTSLRAVLEAGCVPCVAVGPAGTAAGEAADLLTRFGTAGRRFVVGTTSAGALDVLAVPRLAASLRDAGWSRADVDRVVWGRAARLFGGQREAGSIST